MQYLFKQVLGDALYSRSGETCRKPLRHRDLRQLRGRPAAAPILRVRVFVYPPPTFWWLPATTGLTAP
jgi:hypothetical protein